MTNILEIKREQLFAAMTREESDASLARAGAQGRYGPARRHACHQAFARKASKSLIDRAESHRRARKFACSSMAKDSRIGPMAQPLHAMRACDEGHAFESWFANSATYDRQVKRGLVSCPVCNSTKVEKAIMAPRVAGTKRRGDVSVSAPMPEGPASSQPSASNAPPEAPQTNVSAPVAMMSPQEREVRSKLKELREHLIRNADYVGRRFPEEARKMRRDRAPLGLRRGHA
jgi:hypothetical protein